MCYLIKVDSNGNEILDSEGHCIIDYEASYKSMFGNSIPELIITTIFINTLSVLSLLIPDKYWTKEEFRLKIKE